MPIVLYRRSLSLTSGAGQLIRMQAEGLRAGGERVRVACRRGAVKFLLRTGIPVTRLRGEQPPPARHALLVDHGMELPHAHLVFVHGLATEANRHLQRDDWLDEVAREAAFFDALPPSTPLVANSRLVRGALSEHFGVEPERVSVCYPGFRSDKFNPQQTRRYRDRSRRALRVGADTPLVGFVTSGDFLTRGLDLFLDSAEQISAARPDARFLVVGSRELPSWAAAHPLVAGGRVLHRPKSGRPERWLSALDIFLYPSRFDAFGMVVSEAQAMGVPVLTSRRVGAAETLPDAFEPWLLDAPNAAGFAHKTMALLGDEAARQALTSAGLAHAAGLGSQRYMREAADIVREHRPRPAPRQRA